MPHMTNLSDRELDTTIDEVLIKYDLLNEMRSGSVTTLQGALSEAITPIVARLKAERDSLQKAHNYNIDKIASLESQLSRMSKSVSAIDIATEIRGYDIKPHCGEYLTDEQCLELGKIIHDSIMGVGE